VIGDRAFHADAKVVARLALDLAMGLRDAGMAATAKHFPGHGGVVLDSHVAQPVDRRDWWDLDADMYPFRTLLNNGVHSVMTSHVVYSQVDALPASLSPVWIKRILREDMRFQGAVMTDDLSMAGAQAFGGIEQRVQLALEAGADLLLICNHRESVERALAVERGAIPAASALRLARLRAKRLNAEFATMELLNQHPRVMAIRERIVALINRAPDLKLEG
jgi:beta-N-acetylhexosaminidase